MKIDVVLCQAGVVGCIVPLRVLPVVGGNAVVPDRLLGDSVDEAIQVAMSLAQVGGVLLDDEKPRPARPSILPDVADEGEKETAKVGQVADAGIDVQKTAILAPQS